jgi:hypothetical protein
VILKGLMTDDAVRINGPQQHILLEPAPRDHLDRICHGITKRNRRMGEKCQFLLGSKSIKDRNADLAVSLVAYVFLNPVA